MPAIKGQIIIILIDTKTEKEEYIRLCLFVRQYLLVARFWLSLFLLFAAACSLSDAIIVSNGQRQRQTFYLLDQAWKKGELGDNTRQNCDYFVKDREQREKKAEEANDDNKWIGRSFNNNGTNNAIECKLSSLRVANGLATAIITTGQSHHQRAATAAAIYWRE